MYQLKSKQQADRPPYARKPRQPVSFPLITRSAPPLVQRKPACACGGGCPRCQGKLPVQTKLAVSQPGDVHEREADRVADEVMRMPAPEIQRKRSLLSLNPYSLSRSPLDDFSPGQPLDSATRAFFAPRFGHDFSQVRVRADERAAESAQAVNALAYTTGRSIVFGTGQYAPGIARGTRLLAHELTHVLQQAGPTPAHGPGFMVQRQEETADHARDVVIGNPRIDVRAQFALLRLLRGSPEDAATARAMIDEIEKDSLKGIFGDDLKKAADIASLRGVFRWELVPKGQDAVWIHDANPDSPVIVFKEAAGKKPRLDRALIHVYHAEADPNDPFCLTSTELAPACSFTERQRQFLNARLEQARERAATVSQLLTTPGGRDIAEAAAGNLFSDPIPDLAEIGQAVNGTLAILESPTIRFACRTCGDLNCRVAVVAYVFKPGQMPIFICTSRLFSPVFIGEVTRTIIHEAVHLSGIDTDTSETELYCESVAQCAGPCHGKDNAESWARYIDCLGEPLLVPPLIMPGGFSGGRPVPLLGGEERIQREAIPSTFTPGAQSLAEAGEDEEELLHAKPLAGQSGPIHLPAALPMQSLRAHGQPLPARVRDFFEPRLGYDLSGVRVHTEGGAAKYAEQLKAKAFTIGHDVVFAPGQYAPDTLAGKHLLAHELAHTLQQSGQVGMSPPGVIQRSVRITSPYDVKDDFDPAVRVKDRQRAFGRADPILNARSQAPRLRPIRFQNALNKPTLGERNLDKIPRPDLSDPVLDPVRAGTALIMYGHRTRRVKLVQEALVAWGRGLDDPVDMLPRFGPDGIFKDETLGAVTEFQRQSPFLDVDGIVGDETLGELQQAMDDLHGSIFTLDTVPDNDFRGIVHTPPPSSSWTSLLTTRDFVIDHVLTEPLHKAQLAGHFAQCPPGNAVRLFFVDGGNMVKRILVHERRHEKDQVRTVGFHLVPWDAALETFRISQQSFRASSPQEATERILSSLNLRNLCELSTDIVHEWIVDNTKFHGTVAGAPPRLSLTGLGCATLTFTLLPANSATPLTPPKRPKCAGPGPSFVVTREIPI